MIAASDFNIFDFEYLTGHWHGPMGAAFNVVAEDCKEAGWGAYGEPTEAGKKLIDMFRLIPPEGRSVVNKS